MATLKLNVGGTKCQTLKSTLDHVPYFQALFANWQKENKNFEEEVFLDLDYEIFKHGLNKLRDASYEFPQNEIVLQNINNMMGFFGVEIKDTKVLLEREKTSHFKQIGVVHGELNYGPGINKMSLSIDTDKFLIKEVIIFVTDRSISFSIIKKVDEKLANNLILGTDQFHIFDTFFKECGKKESYINYRLRKSYLKIFENVGIITINVFTSGKLSCVVEKII